MNNCKDPQKPCHSVPASPHQGIGPMDGSVSRIPDRRIDAMHTLYRDAQAPLKGPRVMDGICVYVNMYV